MSCSAELGRPDQEEPVEVRAVASCRSAGRVDLRGRQDVQNLRHLLRMIQTHATDHPGTPNPGLAIFNPNQPAHDFHPVAGHRPLGIRRMGVVARRLAARLPADAASLAAGCR